MYARLSLVLGCSLALLACRRPADKLEPADAEADAMAQGAPSASAPASSSPLAPAVSSEPPAEPPADYGDLRCPEEMQYVPSPRPVCVDRWEAILVDRDTGERLSPYYPVNRVLARKLQEEWDDKRKSVGKEAAHSMEVPKLSSWQRENDAEPKAVSRPGQTPNGYLSGIVARKACENAGKRLCLREEWMRACRGAADRPFPYGDTYKQGLCNVVRAGHPAAILHDDASRGHLDPRLLLVKDKDGPFLRRTGITESCRSEWGKQALYDMVGNLDEWVDDPKGMFVGAFFSRGRKDGCDAAITAHPNEYFDYSLGVRCCKDPSQ